MDLGAACLAAQWRRPALTLTNYNHVRNGMSESEVQNLLGDPTESGTILGGKVLVKAWQKDKCAVEVYFCESKIRFLESFAFLGGTVDKLLRRK